MITSEKAVSSVSWEKPKGTAVSESDAQMGESAPGIQGWSPEIPATADTASTKLTSFLSGAAVHIMQMI